jgi:hypothetical protein
VFLALRAHTRAIDLLHVHCRLVDDVQGSSQHKMATPALWERKLLLGCPFEPMDFVNSVVHIRQSPLYDSYKYRPVLLKYSPSGISKVSQ